MSEVSLKAAFGTYRRYAKSDSLEDLFAGIVKGRAEYGRVNKIFSFIDVNNTVQLYYCERPTDEHSVRSSPHCQLTCLVYDNGRVAEQLPDYLKMKFSMVTAPYRITAGGMTARDLAASSDLDTLISLLKHPKDEVCADVVKALRESKNPRYVEPLCELLANGGYRAMLAANALCDIGAERAVEPLVDALNRALKEKSPYSGAEGMASALSAIGDARAVPSMVQFIASDSANKHFARNSFFAKYPDQAIPGLVKALVDPNVTDKFYLSSCLTSLGWKPEPFREAEFFEYWTARLTTEVIDPNFKRTSAFDEWLQRELTGAVDPVRQRRLKEALEQVARYPVQKPMLIAVHFTAGTVEEAKAKAAASGIPPARFHDLEVTRTVQEATAEGEGETATQAQDAARAKVPVDAIDVGFPELVQEREDGVTHVTALTVREFEAKSADFVPKGAKRQRTVCVVGPKAGLLGIGKKAGQWELYWSKPFRARVSYKLPAQVTVRYKG